ncbi:hypothetical protein CNR22_16855 [Sphingobacteriaceae bacterium]|nr:hypothetical protein CNR22_16855 [Sphingobacteriaceae bacterium]
MRIFIFLFFCVLFCKDLLAQVVFCPPGAEWHYNFAMNSTQIENEHIKYVRDTVIGQSTVKLLAHTRFYHNCSTPQGNQYTMLRQNGDTIFFKNFASQNTWQILYNFACQPGQSWQTTFKTADGMSVVTSSYMVSAVTTVTVNNLSLKKMNLGNNQVTERLGCDKFLFMLSNPAGCSTGLFAGNLCYSDSSLGLVQYSNLSCYNDGVTGIKGMDFQLFKVYPNPVNDFISVEDMDSELSNADYSFCLKDIFGHSLMEDISLSESRINVSALPKGIYFLHIFKNERLISTQKILKD